MSADRYPPRSRCLAALVGACIALTVLTPAASRASTAFDLPVAESPADCCYEPTLLQPVIDRGGGVLVGVRTGRARLSIRRWAPGASRLVTVHEEPIPTSRDLNVRLELLAAGAGFVISRADVDCHGPETCRYLTRIGHASLRAYDVTGRTRVTLAACGPVCGQCDPAWLVAADVDHVLVRPSCSSAYRGPVARPAVVDTSTGAQTPFDGGFTYGPTRLAGDFISNWGALGAVDVWNWRTGARVYSPAPRAAWYALLSDGSIIYTAAGADLPVFAVRPDHPAPVALPLHGKVVAAAAGRVLLLDDGARSAAGSQQLQRWQVVTPAGTTIDELSTTGTGVGLSPSVAFDGRRLALLSRTCVTARLLIWDVGRTPPDELASCAAPRVGKLDLGPVRGQPLTRPTAIRLPVSCPASARQGCAGRVTLSRQIAPYLPPYANVRLRPGDTTTLTFGLRVSRGACRSLARDRSLTVTIETGPLVEGPRRSDGVTRPVRKANRCGQHLAADRGP